MSHYGDDLDLAGLPRSATLLDKCKRIRDAGKHLMFPDTKRGKVLSTDANVEAFLVWAGVQVAYDEFAREVRVQGIPDVSRWDDAALVVVRGCLSFFGVSMTAEAIDQAVKFFAGQRRFHPVALYLESLKWDRKPRIDTWLTTYLGVEDSAYVRAVGAEFLIAAVRRVRHPGVKHDTLMVLEGAQGSGKSSAIRALVPNDAWFTDNLDIGADPKIVIELTAAKWIGELPELTGISRSEVEKVKAFVTRQTDEARKAYGRETSKVPRQFVMVGTTNDQQYLIDPTGNRRFLPILVPGGSGSIDLEGIRRDRDQLWAEAAHREALGEPHEMPRELWEWHRVEVEKRRLRSPIEDEITELVEGVEAGFIPSKDLSEALGFHGAGRKEIRHTQQIIQAMRKHGWVLVDNAVRFGGERLRGWRKGDGWKDRLLRAHDLENRRDGGGPKDF